MIRPIGTLATLATLAWPTTAPAGPAAGGPGRSAVDPAEVLPDLPPIPGPVASRPCPAPVARTGRPEVAGEPAPLRLAAHESPAPAGGSPPALQADAGDDVIALAGRQVTLNGIRSQPRGRIGYRWVQCGGPTVRLKIEDGYIYTFVPAEPGVYRFLLLVAAGGAISEPDAVTVTVGNPSAPTPGAAGEGPAAPPPPEATLPLEEAARAALARVPGGLDAGGALAEAFEGVAQRLDLYRSYAELYQELSRRIARTLPAGEAPRLAWEERLFAPLTARLIGAMAVEGLDLRTVAGQQAPMTPAQRARLAEQFRAMAAGFRSNSPGR